MGKAKTHEEFVQEVADKFPWIKVLGFYSSSQTKIEVEDTRCGHRFKITPNSLLSRNGKCTVCSKEKIKLNLIKVEVRPLEKVLAEIEEKYPGMFKYINGYNGVSKKCWWECKICHSILYLRPQEIMRGQGCNKCKKSIGDKIREKLTAPLEKMLEQLKEVWGDLIEYVSDYKNMHEKCKFKCTICGCFWETTPDSIIKGKHGCPKCARKRNIIKHRVSLEEFLKRLKEAWGDLIVYVSGYIMMSKKCKFKCTVCGFEWETTPKAMLNKRHNTGCPFCIKDSMEVPVKNLLKELNVSFLHDVSLLGCNYNNSKTPLRIDFLIKTKKGILAIETDGKQHFIAAHGMDELQFQQNKDRYKDKWCKEKGYILIRVTSAHDRAWGTSKHLVMAELFELLRKATNNGKCSININLFKPYDFNRE